MVNKLKYYVWCMGEDVDDSIEKVMAEFPEDVADISRIFDSDYNEIKRWLKESVTKHEES